MVVEEDGHTCWTGRLEITAAKMRIVEGRKNVWWGAWLLFELAVSVLGRRGGCDAGTHCRGARSSGLCAG